MLIGDLSSIVYDVGIDVDKPSDTLVSTPYWFLTCFTFSELVLRAFYPTSPKGIANTGTASKMSILGLPDDCHLLLPPEPSVH